LTAVDFDLPFELRGPKKEKAKWKYEEKKEGIARLLLLKI
jgi:hypothetical protein